MRKLLLLVLVAALGAAAYFYFNTSSRPSEGRWHLLRIPEPSMPSGAHYIITITRDSVIMAQSREPGATAHSADGLYYKIDRKIESGDTTRIVYKDEEGKVHGIRFAPIGKDRYGIAFSYDEDHDVAALST